MRSRPGQTPVDLTQVCEEPVETSLVLLLPWPSAWPFLRKHTQMAASSSFLRHSSLVMSHCRCSGSFYWKAAQKHSSVFNGNTNNHRLFFPSQQKSCKQTFSGGLASTGAPSVHPAWLFFKFSLTCVRRSSRSTLSASFARQASSRWDSCLLREDFLKSAFQKHRDNNLRLNSSDLHVGPEMIVGKTGRIISHCKIILLLKTICRGGSWT